MFFKPTLFAAPALAFALALAAIASPAASQDEERAPSAQLGKISTIERGIYACELPGTADTQRGIAQPAENFRIASASRYVTREGRGTYLRRGDILLLTSGPRNGASYAIVSERFLRKIENGEAGRLRCIRSER